MEATSECLHRWRIPTPDGPTSLATCNLCGERREFRNSIDSDDASSVAFRGTNRRPKTPPLP